MVTMRITLPFLPGSWPLRMRLGLRLGRGRLRLGRGAAGARGVGFQLGDRVRAGLADRGVARLRRRGRRGGGDAAVRPVFLGDHGRQRIDGAHRIQVEDQAVPVAGHRGQVEHLRLDLFLEVEHQAHHVRAVLGDPHMLDVGIVRFDLGDQAFQGLVERQAVDVDHQARRIGQHEVGGFQVAVVFQGDAGVLVGRPDAHGHDLGGARGRGRQRGADDGQQQRAAGLQDGAALGRVGNQGVGG
jgi:hypothetical protein